MDSRRSIRTLSHARGAQRNPRITHKVIQYIVLNGIVFGCLLLLSFSRMEWIDLCWMGLYCSEFYSIELYCIELYCIVFLGIGLYCIVLNCIVLYRIVRDRIVLY